MGRLGYARSAGGSGGRGKLRLNRAKDILSSKTPEPQVGVARVSPLSCGPVQGNWNATVMKQADEEVPLLGNSTVLFGTFGCLENVYSGRHAHAQGQGQGTGAQSILLPSTIDNRFNASITTSVQGGMWGDARMAARRLAWERLARSLLSCVSSSHRSNSVGPNRSRGSISRTTR